MVDWRKIKYRKKGAVILNEIVLLEKKYSYKRMKVFDNSKNARADKQRAKVQDKPPKAKPQKSKTEE